MSTEKSHSQTAALTSPHPAVPTVGAIPPAHSSRSVQRDNPASALLAVAQQLRSVRAQASDVNEAVGILMRQLMACQGVVAASHFHRDDKNQFIASTPLICKQALAARARGWEPALIQAVGESVNGGRSVTIHSLSDESLRIICCTVGDLKSPTAAFCIFMDPSVTDTSELALLMQIAASELGTYSASTKGTDRAAIDQFITAAGTLRQSGNSYQELAMALESTLRVAQVLIGTKTGRGQCRLEGASGVASIARPSKLVTVSEEVLAEAALRDEIHVADTRRPQTMNESNSQLAQLLRAGRILSGPLRDKENQRVGAWIVIDDGTANDTPRAVPLLDQCQSLAGMVAGITSLLTAAKPTLLTRILRTTVSAFSGKQKRITYSAITVLSLLLSAPWPYRLACDCELQTVKRRYVAAPYDGQLKEVLVAPGDLVTAGQILARMDRSELEWRIAAQDAEYQRASKQHDSSMAQRETSSVQVARLEMKRISAELGMLRQRAENLEIRSPIDGVVLAGDPKQLEGARLTVGQTLFETGPLDKMLVEIYIPHDEVTHFQVGNRASVRLDALPHRTFEGDVVHLNPQSESREGKNIFVAEVNLDNDNHLLRPGMIGRSRLTTTSHAIAWNLFHKPLARIIRLARW